MTSMNEGMDNLVKAIDNEEIDVEGVVNVVMANAYAQSKKVDKHLQEVKDELAERAEAVKLENPGTGPKIENDYTKLVLEEDLKEFTVEEVITPAIKDGRSHRDTAWTEDEGNRYLDYDMFTFIHELFAGQHCNTNPAPITPVINGPMDSPDEVKRKAKVKKLRQAGKEPSPEDLKPFPPIWGMRKMRKYLDIAVEDAASEEGFRKSRVPQIATDGDVITISARKRLDLHDVVEACKIYHLNCSDIKAYRNSYWDFYIDVEIPQLSPGYPMMLDDFLRDNGMRMEDVMPPEFCRRYEKAYKKAMKTTPAEADNEFEVQKIFKKAVDAAAEDDLPFEVHARDLIKELEASGLTFDAEAIKKAFMSEFE